MKRILFQVLHALGTLVFCVGIVIVPVISGLTVGNQVPVFPEIAWVVGLMAAFVWFWAGVHFLIRPNDPGSTGRIIASVIVFLALLVGHPWLIGLPGRISEFRLEHSLGLGMTVAQATEIVNGVGGVAQNGSPTNLTVRFTDSGTFCEASGLDYSLIFDEHQKLRSWTSDEWFEGC